MRGGGGREGMGQGRGGGINLVQAPQAHSCRQRGAARWTDLAKRALADAAGQRQVLKVNQPVGSLPAVVKHRAPLRARKGRGQGRASGWWLGPAGGGEGAPAAASTHTQPHKHTHTATQAHTHSHASTHTQPHKHTHTCTHTHLLRLGICAARRRTDHLRRRGTGGGGRGGLGGGDCLGEHGSAGVADEGPLHEGEGGWRGGGEEGRPPARPRPAQAPRICFPGVCCQLKTWELSTHPPRCSPHLFARRLLTLQGQALLLTHPPQLGLWPELDGACMGVVCVGWGGADGGGRREGNNQPRRAGGGPRPGPAAATAGRTVVAGGDHAHLAASHVRQPHPVAHTGAGGA